MRQYFNLRAVAWSTEVLTTVPCGDAASVDESMQLDGPFRFGGERRIYGQSRSERQITSQGIVWD
jgi:hypothetical protein